MTDPLRVGLIGCGSIARLSHIPLLHAAGAKVVACASRSAESAKLAADEAGGDVEVFVHWNDLVQSDNVDAVVIATPNALHAGQALGAIRASKHVLIEKPISISVEQADAVIDAAKRFDVVAMTAHNVRFDPTVQALRESRDDWGVVHSVRAGFSHAGPRAWAPRSEWFFDPRLSGGGALMDLGVHLVDTLRYLLDDDFATLSATVDQAPIEQDAALSFATHRGVVGTLQAGWRSTHGSDFQIRIYGDKATAVLDSYGPRLIRAGAQEVALPTPAQAESVQAAFVAAVEAGQATSPTAHDGRAAVAVVEAAYESARTGRRTAVAKAGA